MQLILLLDQGEEVQGQRWQSSSGTFCGLQDVLASVKEPAIVLLGPPGSGKSTLLRHFELDNARTALLANNLIQAPLTLFVSLNAYAPQRGHLPDPLEWLQTQWAGRFPALPPLDALLRERQVTLLLDAFNEIPAATAMQGCGWGGRPPSRSCALFLEESRIPLHSIQATLRNV